MALPPHVSARIRVTPELPVLRREVIQRFQPPRVINCVGVFAEPWWRAKGFSGLANLDTGGFASFVDGSHVDSRYGILVGFVSSRRSAELPYDSVRDIETAYLRSVRAAFGEGPEPKSIHYNNWNSDPLTRGGYAGARGIGDWVQGKDILSRPQGRIHFAGTETARAWRGYIEGALESGERAAGEILEAAARTT